MRGFDSTHIFLFCFPVRFSAVVCCLLSFFFHTHLCDVISYRFPLPTSRQDGKSYPRSKMYFPKIYRLDLQKFILCKEQGEEIDSSSAEK
ncbi:hypothetical protein BDB00DRAFT_845475 [Zychaea mexicana]|uniref:uncharacterized protein n=1 Tax=Zychaea mexicana TaxID=64656 RepID=UPI0022FE9E28|nr:uncharacterized protein BDB00DRAFT_845475 [Zychaea mexicana]KAI9489049.1 hypothetical protein BDB00DRAFT_845475 [Zychaea mexicana]